MAVPDAAYWSDLQRQALMRYDDALLRQVAARLVKPRNSWPSEELIERSVATVANPAVLDRRLQELEPAGRQLLALIGHSRQPLWSLGNLVEMLMTLGQADGLKPIFDVLSAGLLYPYALSPHAGDRLKTFEQWLGFPGPGGLNVFAHPLAASRAIGERLGLPDLSRGLPPPTPLDGQPADVGAPSVPAESLPEEETTAPTPTGPALESDGLEWLIRLAALWQQAHTAPFRRTQQGGLFKRDYDRLAQDSLLNGPPAEYPSELPDPAFLAACLADLEGVLREGEGEWRAVALPLVWEAGLLPSLESLYADLFRLRDWNPLAGWRGGEEPAGNPFPSSYLLALLALARLPTGVWASSSVLAAWLASRHPYWNTEALRPSWQRPWLEAFLLGVAFPLRLLQVARSADGPLVRLTAVGRWLLGSGPAPELPPPFPRTLLVQPNLEVLAYRQGLNPALLARLTRLGTWKSLGAACLLQLEPHTVYRALEAGQTFDTIRLTLEQHGTRALPAAVVDALRTWADKRERIVVYPSATLLEFASAADLDAALARGLPASRIAEALAVVASEEAIDFRNFRLTGTRDYGLPPERCVTAEADGVSLTVDVARSDLVLETELPRFAERLDGGGAGQRLYRLTPTSLTAARNSGVTATSLESWFQQRTGQPLPAAARLLLTGAQLPPPRLQRHLVLHVAAAELADGLMQWPDTRGLIAARLGPTALAVTEEAVPRLRERLQAAGIVLGES
jgi:hypothetical protein